MPGVSITPRQGFMLRKVGQHKRYTRGLLWRGCFFVLGFSFCFCFKKENMKLSP